MKDFLRLDVTQYAVMSSLYFCENTDYNEISVKLDRILGSGNENGENSTGRG